MPESEAMATLSVCCKLSPPNDKEDKQLAVDAGRVPGHFIFSRDGKRLLGTIYFLSGRVMEVTRPLGDEVFAPWNDDVVRFARTLDRSLSPATGESDKTIHLSVRHERASNGNSAPHTVIHH